jgi:pimeloyl-ACP methyl ester carboxylesterase
MLKFIRLTLVCLFVLSLVAPLPAYAQSSWPPICQEGSLPSHDPRYPADQLIVVCIPPNWNSQLVVYAHGYVPPQAPLALPLDELTLPDGTFVPNLVLAQGYAFATSSYHKNGYAVEQARKDLNDLVNYVKQQVGPGSLQKVFIAGASEGAEVATLLIEHYPDKYDGALVMCGPIGGAPYQIQYLSDFRAVFDYFFPDVFPFGVTDVPPTEFLNWPNDVQAIAQALTLNPAATAQLFSVTGAAVDPLDPASAVTTAIGVLFYSIWGTNDLVAAANGMPYDNQSIVYSGSFNDAALNAGVERVKADPRAQSYMRRYYQPTGELKRPMVTLHNALDPAVPFRHEVIYSELVAAAGRSSFLTVNPVPLEATYGHCDFTASEVGAAFQYLVLQAGP